MSGTHPPSLRRSFVIQNRLGLHARAAALFVQTVAAVDAEVFVTKDGETVNGKSIMGLMMLAAAKGSKVKFIATGADAAAMLAEIEALFARKFDEA